MLEMQWRHRSASSARAQGGCQCWARLGWGRPAGSVGAGEDGVTHILERLGCGREAGSVGSGEEGVGAVGRRRCASHARDGLGLGGRRRRD